MSDSSRRYLFFSAFVAGMTKLAVPHSASRLLGNIFGTSNIVWANIIGLILLYLAAGYFLGGRWADRSPHPVTFYQLLLWAAFTSGLVPLVAKPVLGIAARAVESFDAAVMAGSFLAVLMLFAVPVTLLGCASPFAIRLAIRGADDAGRTAGLLYATSTLGSLLGTFTPVLLLIPTLGTSRTFLAFAGTLMAVALWGLAQVDRRRALAHLWMPLALAALAFVLLRGPVKPIDGLLFETESPYNLVQVVERGSTRYLLLNEGQGVHSVYDPDSLATFGTWDYFLAAPYFNPAPHSPAQVRRLALVGSAAGTITKQYAAVYGPIPMDAFEIDPDIVDAGRRYFEMNEPSLNVQVVDGRWGLRESGETYSVVGVDAYRLPYIPWHLTTREFFEEARARMTDDGALVINVGRTHDDRRLVDAMAGTVGSVFPSVYVVDVPNTFNSLVLATVRPGTSDDLARNLALLSQDPSVHPLLLDVLARTLANLQPTPASGIVFTDDNAPVEQLTNSIVLRFLLSGSLEMLGG